MTLPVAFPSVADSRVLTLLFTDIENSTRMVHALGDRGWAGVLAEHHALLRHAFQAHGGCEVKTEGDSFFVVFDTAEQAVSASVEAQRGLAGHVWPADARVKARMGMHTGSVQTVGTDFLGLAVHEAARVADAAHGGQVLLSQATRDALTPPGNITVRDLGRHAMKDFLVPQRLFQAAAPDLDQEFPPLRTLSSAPHNLPAPPTPLLGRETELAAAVAALRGSGRVLTLTGPGGIGKSRLAVETARRVLPYFPGGVWFVALADVSDPEMVLAHAQATMGLAEQPGLSASDVLTQHVTGRDRVLLLLDNFEHLLPAATAVAQLAARSELFSFLVTSRHRLHIRGEQVLEVGSLDPDEALLLFEECCRSLSPNFSIDDGTHPLATQVCLAVDGVPLALELAAAHIRLGLPALVSALAEGLEVLSDGPVDLPARQQALAATIDWSYRLLTQEQREAFCRLAVFAGGADPEAATALLATPELLMSLVDQSLLRSTDGRWTMLETIRHFALAQLADAGLREEMETAHAQWFRELAAEARQHFGTLAERAWLQRLHQERANLNRALDRWWLVHPAFMAQMSADLGPYWEIRGSLAEATQWLHLAREAVPADDAELRAELVHWSGRIALQRGDPEGARRYLEEDLCLHRERDDDHRVGRALNSLGEVARTQHDAAAAQAHHQSALERFERAGDAQGVGISHQNLGAVALHQGDFPVASTHLAQALDVLRLLGDERRVGRVRVNMGYALMQQRRFDEATAVLTDAMGSLRAIGDQEGLARALQNLGFVHSDQGHLDAAATCWAEALIIQRERGNAGQWATTAALLGQTAIALGERSVAAGYLTEAAAAFGAKGMAAEEAEALLLLSEIVEPSSVAAKTAEDRTRHLIAAAADPALMIEELLSDAEQRGSPQSSQWLLDLAAHPPGRDGAQPS